MPKCPPHLSGIAALAILIGASAVAAQQSSTSAPEGADRPQSVTVEMTDGKGQPVGEVEVRGLAHGTLFVVELRDLPAGPHGFHIHETGKCEPPDFQSAGGHYNPTDAAHGFDSPDGYHVGDLPNIQVGDDGTASAEFFSARVVLARQVAEPGARADAAFPLLDPDGSALMVHADADDHQDMDSAGSRLACGVIEAS